MIKKALLLFVTALFLIPACEKMDDNYKMYLETEQIYSPKVTNLTADEGLREVTLYWNNPTGDIAKRILIDYVDDSLEINAMIDSAYISDLEIKGYTVSVYTIDEFDNRSVPETITIFPNGEN